MPSLVLSVRPVAFPRAEFTHLSERKLDVALGARDGFMPIPMIQIKFPPFSANSVYLSVNLPHEPHNFVIYTILLKKSSLIPLCLRQVAYNGQSSIQILLL